MRGGGVCASFLRVTRSDKYFSAGIKHFHKAVNMHFNNAEKEEEEETHTPLSGGHIHKVWPVSFSFCSKQTNIINSKYYQLH